MAHVKRALRSPLKNVITRALTQSRLRRMFLNWSEPGTVPALLRRSDRRSSRTVIHTLLTPAIPKTWQSRKPAKKAVAMTTSLLLVRAEA